MAIVLNLGIREAYERTLKKVDELFFRIILFFQRYVRFRPNTILLLRQDAIGDYVRFRNFITVLKTSERFKEYDITLCGNSRWRELSETCDSDTVADFIWLNRARFQSSRPYKYLSLLRICGRGYSILIHPTYSREPYADTLARFIKAEQKIGSQSDPGIRRKFIEVSFDDVYDRLIEVTQEPKFEFFRNKDFFERLLGVHIGIDLYAH